jgi:hypothetical protein
MLISVTPASYFRQEPANLLTCYARSALTCEETNRLFHCEPLSLPHRLMHPLNEKQNENVPRVKGITR